MAMVMATAKAPGPLVSVVLPYRDAGETIEEAIESVLADRDVDLELVAVDDGSRDDGPLRVRRICSADSRVVMASTSDAGANASANTDANASARSCGIVAALQEGIRVARGELIARMDGDDISLPGRLARQRDALLADARLGALGTQVEAFPDAAVAEGMRRYVRWQNTLITPEDHAREIFIESPLCHPSVMIRRSALDAVGGFRDGPWPEDYDLWLRLDEAGFLLAKVPEILLRWRHREGRATFTDPRYAIARFIDAKARYIAPRLRRMAASRGELGEALSLVIWGAGKTGKQVARAIEKSGLQASLFIDIDPRKIGRTARGAAIAPPSALVRGRHLVVVAVGARGARDLIRDHLSSVGFIEGSDFLCAA